MAIRLALKSFGGDKWQEQDRRRSLLAVLLALIAAGALCMIGAAAGITFSFQLVDSIASFFSGDRSTAGGIAL